MIRMIMCEYYIIKRFDILRFDNVYNIINASVKNFDVLYTGDIEENGQLDILNMNIESEILKVPHQLH